MKAIRDAADLFLFGWFSKQAVKIVTIWIADDIHDLIEYKEDHQKMLDAKNNVKFTAVMAGRIALK